MLTLCFPILPNPKCPPSSSSSSQSHQLHVHSSLYPPNPSTKSTERTLKVLSILRPHRAGINPLHHIPHPTLLPALLIRDLVSTRRIVLKDQLNAQRSTLQSLCTYLVNNLRQLFGRYDLENRERIAAPARGHVVASVRVD